MFGLINKTIYRSADGGGAGAGGGAGETPLTPPPSDGANTPQAQTPPAGDNPQSTPEEQQKQPENPLAYWQAQAEKFERLHKKATEEATSAKTLLEQLQNETVKQLTDKFNQLQQELEAERKRASEATTEALRAKVIAEFRLGNEAVAFLTGSDEATLRQQAESLSKLTGAKGTPPPTGNVGNPASFGGELTVEAVKHMSPSEIMSRLDEVRKVLAKAGGK